MLADPLQNIRRQIQDLQHATRQHPPYPNPTRSSAPGGRTCSTIKNCPMDRWGCFENVSFHYEENENVLDQIHFNIRPVVCSVY
jgi:ABC-type multidrug transport system fused ATPase/permease subunit